MTINIKIDKYDIRARIIPGVLLCIPVLITVGAIGVEYFGWLTSICGSVFITGVLSYGLSMLLRSGGVALQQKMYKQWGGPPSTTFLRWSDSRFSEQKKTLIRNKIKKDFKMELLSREDEQADPNEADRVISDAFDSIRAKLRSTGKTDGLWKIHNIEYGFYRNFLGSWLWGLIMSIAGIIVLLAIYHYGMAKDPRYLIAAGMDFIYGMILVIYVLGHGKQNIRHAAEQYVITAIETYLSLK